MVRRLVILLSLAGGCSPVPGDYPSGDELAVDFLVSGNRRVEIRDYGGFGGCPGSYYLGILGINTGTGPDVFDLWFPSREVGQLSAREISDAVGRKLIFKMELDGKLWYVDPDWNESRLDFSIDGTSGDTIWGSFSGHACLAQDCIPGLSLEEGRYSAVYHPSPAAKCN